MASFDFEALDVADLIAGYLSLFQASQLDFLVLPERLEDACVDVMIGSRADL